MNISRMLDAKQFEDVCQYLRDRLGVEFDTAKLAKHLKRSPRQLDGCDDCLFMWLKNRLDDLGVFAGKRQALQDHIVTAIFHVGFIYLEETPEMLARLPEGGTAQPSVASSKISQTQQVIQPIDRVAARVVTDT